MQDQTFDIPLQPVIGEITRKAGVNLYVLRLDQNHPFISGNKLFKLRYNLQEAEKQNKRGILTFGGAFSNHIAATAAAGKEYGFKTTGIIRGDQTEVLNPILAFAKSQGMELHFISREMYRQKGDPAFLQQLKTLLNDDLSDVYIIPEGGASALGIKGCAEITGHIHIPFDTICCACGTGTTLAGIVLSLKENQRALGFQVLKGENYLQNEVRSWLSGFDDADQNWEINEAYHFGGYAKTKPELLRFMHDFENTQHIPLDFIYTGKMVYGIYDLLQKGEFKPGETIIAVHTGGLQGKGML